MSLYSKGKIEDIEELGYWKKRTSFFGVANRLYPTVFISDCKNTDEYETILRYPHKGNSLLNIRLNICDTSGCITVGEYGVTV